MREIRFRGKDIHTGEWYYGSDKPFGGCSRWLHLTEFFQNGGEVAIDPATVGQWTGIQDCNGKDIYEGDIVDHPERESERSEYIVVWDDVGFTLEIGGDGYYFGDVDAKTTIEWEVIGNIHEVTNEGN